MQTIEDQLKKIGLRDYEAQIYALLLKISPATASHIARKCHLSRSSVYTTLNSLISKGLVSITYKNEVKMFIAEDQTALEELLKKEKTDLDEKFKVFKSFQENIKTIQKIGLNIPQVVFFEGQEGLKKIYLSMMSQASKNSILYLIRDEFVWQPEWQFVHQDDWGERVSYFKANKNIETALLINNSSIENQHLKCYQEKQWLKFKFLPKTNSVKQFALYILDDMISIISTEKNNLVGIQITNQSIADNFKKIFETMWSGVLED